jgi:hypothetical protein
MNNSISLEYDDLHGIIWIWIDNRKYLLVQSSGELTAGTGFALDDYYWSDTENGTAQIVRDALQEIVIRFNKGNHNE